MEPGLLVVPEGQGVHTAPPLLGLYVLAGQFTHFSPVGTFPAGHTTADLKNSNWTHCPSPSLMEDLQV